MAEAGNKITKGISAFFLFFGRHIWLLSGSLAIGGISLIHWGLGSEEHIDFVRFLEIQNRIQQLQMQGKPVNLVELLNQSPVPSKLWSHTIEVIGISLMIEAVLSLIHHYILHKKDINGFQEIVYLKMSDIAGSMTTQVNDNTQQIIQSVEDRTNRLKDAVTEVVRNEVSTIHKFNSLGLINIYEKLSLSTIIEKIKSTGGELAVQRMYFSGAEFQLLEELDYADLIEKRNCSFRFLLLHPNESNTIKKKMSSFSKFSNDARALEKEKERIVGTIHHQLKFLEEKKAELTELKLGDQFQFKIHQDFVSIPLTKYKDKIIFSAYLDHRYAEDGIQFVSRKADKAKLYNELLEHYEHRWERAESYKGHIIKPNANR